MKTQKSPLLTDARLGRIRKISRILKAMLLMYLFVVPLLFIVSPGPASWRFSGHDYTQFTDVPGPAKLLAALNTTIYLGFVIVFYRLLNLYEGGVIFAAENARHIRLLGYLGFGNGLLGVVAPVLSSSGLAFPICLLDFISSPWVIGGLFGIMISHIMDEGCRLREEQDLTV